MADWSITQFEVRPDYKIRVTFQDGTSGIADLSPRLSQGALGDGFDALCDKKIFAAVYLEHGALTWPGGIDLAPDAMYERIQESGVSVLKKKDRRVA
ncbi:MAG: DUF2442 domain-containing protein [Gammaproteobacteria bacterium]|nr:DUF2442 domain-containing protein [Gammaproteobacteria bacterium]